MKLRLSLMLGLTTFLSCAQNGVRLQYVISGQGEEKAMYSLTVLSKNGHSIQEYREATSGELINTSLKLKNKPDVSYSLLGEAYMEIPDQQLKVYQVSVQATEKVNGYNCTKVLVTAYKGGDAVNVWLSKDVPGYENGLSTYVGNLNIAKLNEALKQKDAGGIPVKFESRGEDLRVLELVSLTTADPDDSLFEVKQKQQGRTSDELKKRNEITEEQYQMMKVEEERARQEYENKQKKTAD